MRIALIFTVIASPALADAPSGLDWDLQEVIFEPADAAPDARETIRLRYLSAPIADAQTAPFEVIEGDFSHFCQSEGLTQRSQFAPNATQIIVSVASDQLAFGETAPEVIQYFEAFRLEGDACVWDGF